MAWDLLAENFNDLTDWTDNDSGDGVSEISPAGYLHQTRTSSGLAIIDQDIGAISGDYTVELKVKPDAVDYNNNFFAEGSDGTLYFKMVSDGLYIFNGTSWVQVITETWNTSNYYTIRLIVHNSQTDCDVYLDGELKTSDADCTYGGAQVGVTIKCGTDNSEWHWDYLYIGAGQQVPSTTSIKKVSGVAYASIKKIGGVAIGSVKKIAGVE